MTRAQLEVRRVPHPCGAQGCGFRANFIAFLSVVLELVGAPAAGALRPFFVEEAPDFSQRSGAFKRRE